MKAEVKKQSQQKNEFRKIYISLIALLTLSGIIMIFICAGKFSQTIAVGAKAAGTAFHTAKDLEKTRIYNEYYDKSRAAAEKKYHTSNRAVIVIDEVREKAELQVLQVSAIGYSIEDKKDNNTATSWIKVSGTGTFTVNLKAGEYLIDQERHSVLVRIPKPQLAHFAVADTEKIVYEDGAWELIPGFSIFNGNTGQGTDLAQKQISDAAIDAKSSISSNQRFYQKAEESAEKMILNFIKEVNGDIPDLTVTVEFMD